MHVTLYDYDTITIDTSMIVMMSHVMQHDYVNQVNMPPGDIVSEVITAWVFNVNIAIAEEVAHSSSSVYTCSCVTTPYRRLCSACSQEVGCLSL